MESCVVIVAAANVSGRKLEMRQAPPTIVRLQGWPGVRQKFTLLACSIASKACSYITIAGCHDEETLC